MPEPTSLVSERRPAGVAARVFAASGPPVPGLQAWFVGGLRAALLEQGFTEQAGVLPPPQVVVHPVDMAAIKPFRRKAAPTFVVAIGALDGPPDDVLRTGYPVLVRALANLAVVVSPSGAGPVAHFVTLEQGRYAVSHDGDDHRFFERVFERIAPLATSRLVIANDFVPDLPAELHAGDETTSQITRAGEKLDALDLLPAAFPIEDILSERDLRHVKLMFGIGGLSYGNVSARRPGATPSPIGPEFWMSASGVDKGNLRTIGHDILLVKGYDAERDTMVLSVPPDVAPRRVSVDAIEHWMIYREHPEVGAIVHVHAWIDGAEATEINYPCGTLELGTAVADLVRRSPDPSRAVVGQRNHGLTITGRSLDEIFERVDGKLVRNVPMQ